MFNSSPLLKREENDPLSPPLPLLRFGSTASLKSGPATVNGEQLKTLPNMFDSSSSAKADRIFDPVLAKKLSKWFIARSQKEVNYKQMEVYTKHFQAFNGEEQKIDLFEYIVYESLLYVESKAERVERNERRPTEYQIHLTRAQDKLLDEAAENPIASSSNIRKNLSTASLDSSSGDEAGKSNRKTPTPTSTVPNYSPSLIFDSEFESGNLEKASRVIGRETLLNSKSLDHINDYALPTDVDQEYDLTLRNDINTEGNIQWYYFSTKIDSSVDGISVNFPLKVRFNIINMQKKDSLYNYGMRPAIYSVLHGEEYDWFNGGYDICYYKNGLTNYKSGGKKKVSVRNQYTFTFTYTFEHPDTVYFAYTFPYTYSDLQRYLLTLDSDTKITNIFHRRNLCNSLAGNRCDVLTITERTSGAVESKFKPGVVISARIHPGESNSSFVVHGLIQFLCSDAPEAVKLRKAFIFTIVPMLNVDGVIHGNYRCSLAGTDLNRRFIDCHPSLHPVIVAFKELVKTIQKNRSIALFLDLHGHSKLKNSFIYGCDVTLQPEKYARYLATCLSEEEINHRRIFCRIFPKILCTMSKSTATNNGYFSYRDCSFNIDKSKFGTGRVVSWRDLGVLAAYTIEFSFCGNGDNHEKKLLKKWFDGCNGSNSRNGGMSYAKTTTAAAGKGISAKKKKSKKLKRRKSKFLAMSLDADHNLNGTDSNNYGVGDDEEYADDDGGGGDENDNDCDGEQEVTALSTKSAPKPVTVPLDSSTLALLESYKTATMYQKQDLLLMGKQICQAIYHFANLTHADLEYEKEIILQNDREVKERQRKAAVEKQLMLKYPVNTSNFSTVKPIANTDSVMDDKESGNDRNNRKATAVTPSGSLSVQVTTDTTEQQETDEFAEEEEIDYYRQAIDKLYGPNASVQRSTDAISKISINDDGANSPLLGIGEDQSSRYNNRFAVSEDGDVVYNYEDNRDIGIAANRNGSAKKRVVKLIGDDNDNYDIERSGKGEDADQDFDNNDEENSDRESDDSGGEDYVPGNNNDGIDGNKSTKTNQVNPPNATTGANLSELFSNYLAIRLESYESKMSIRALYRSGVFQLSAIHSLIQSYSQEFLVEKSTQNIGFRIKCELAIRKLLKLDEKIDASLALNLLEEEADSGDESESQPSVDNQPTSKLLKAVGADGGLLNLNVVNALKEAIRKRKHRELLLKKKREKKLALKLMKQAEIARRLAIENERIAQKEREDRARQRPQSASAYKFDPSKRRRGGIHSSLPKFAPLYRMAPAEPKINVPVQIKIVNFKDFDQKKGRVTTQYLSQPPQFQQQQPPPWSQINAVYFDEDPLVNHSNASMPPVNLFPPLSESPPDPNPLLQSPKFRGSSIYLNNNNSNRGVSNHTDPYQKSSYEIVSHNIQADNRVQILVASEPSTGRLSPSNLKYNHERASNDANIIYAPTVDLTPVIPKSMLNNNSNTSSSRRPSQFAYKPVPLEFNPPDEQNPSVVNSRRVTMTSNPTGNDGNYNDPENFVPVITSIESSLSNKQRTYSASPITSPDYKSSPKVGKSRKSSIVI